MVDINLLYGFLLLLGAFVYYKIHKSWLKARNADITVHKPLTLLHKIKDWIIIIALLILSIINFCK